MTVAIVDTGPLVALFDRAERHHRWVVERFEELDAPLLVCEPVLAEAMYLLARYPKTQDAVLGLIENGALSVAFRLDEHLDALRKNGATLLTGGHTDVAGRCMHRSDVGSP